MGKAQTVNTELGEVTARELTVRQVRNALDATSQGVPHIIDILYAGENVPSSVVAISTGLHPDSTEERSLMDFSTGDMRKIIQAVKEANPDFLDLAERLKAAVEAQGQGAILTGSLQGLSE